MPQHRREPQFIQDHVVTGAISHELNARFDAVLAKVKNVIPSKSHAIALAVKEWVVQMELKLAQPETQTTLKDIERFRTYVASQVSVVQKCLAKDPQPQ